MIHLLALLGLAVLGLIIRSFALIDISSSAAYGMGMIMLIGYCAGQVFRKLGIPSITGYLVAGMAIGPFGMELITRAHVEDLTLINGLALSLIALTAGGEIRISRLRPHLKTITWVLVMQTVTMVTGMTAGFWFLATRIPNLTISTQTGILAAGLLIGVVSTASSPSTTLAVIVESGRRSVTTDLILGIVMLKDIVILFLFCIGLNVAQALTSASSGNPSGLGNTFFQISGSVIVGVLIGVIIIAFLKYIKSQQVIFILAICFFTYEIFEPLKLHPLLIMMSAGFLVVNLSREGDRLMDHLEEISPPVYVLFFTLAGAALRLDLLKTLGLTAMILVILRIACKWAGTWLGLRTSGTMPYLRHRGWTAFVSQAGLSLGLATIIADQFPGWGDSIALLILSAIFINQLIGPLTLKWLLDRDGK